jgi:hypothetical protein
MVHLSCHVHKSDDQVCISKAYAPLRYTNCMYYLCSGSQQTKLMAPRRATLSQLWSWPVSLSSLSTYTLLITSKYVPDRTGKISVVVGPWGTGKICVVVGPWSLAHTRALIYKSIGSLPQQVCRPLVAHSAIQSWKLQKLETKLTK